MKKSPWRGCFAGCMGGLAGTLAMSGFHLALNKSLRRKSGAGHRGDDATVVAAQAIARGFGRRLRWRQKRPAGRWVHYVFGTSVAAAYGAAVERLPRLAAWEGVPFGCAVWLGAHVAAAPALGLAKPITQSSATMELVEFAAHVVYGTVTETVRHWTRKGLN